MKAICAALCIGIISSQAAFAGHYTARGDYISTAKERIGDVGDVMQFVVPLSAAVYSMAIGDWQGLKQLGYSTGSTLGATYLLKFTTLEERPSQPEGSKGHTFPSGHTAMAAAGAGYWQRRYGWLAGIPAYAAMGFVGYSCVVTKNHNWLDVGAGAALGIGANMIFTSRYNNEQTNITLSPTDGGAYLSFSTKF